MIGDEWKFAPVEGVYIWSDYADRQLQDTSSKYSKNTVLEWAYIEEEE